MGIIKRNAGKLALIALIVFFSLPFIYSNEEEEDFSPFAIKSGLSYQANPISKLANRIASFYGLPKSDLTTTSERVNMNTGENIRHKVSGHKTFNKNQIANNEPGSENQAQEINNTQQGKGKHKAAYNSGYEKYFNKDTKQNDFLQGSVKKTNNTNINITNNVGTSNADTPRNQKAAAAARARSNYEGGDPTIYEPARESPLATTATSVNYNNYIYNKPSNTVAEEYVEIDGDKFKVIQDITGKKYVATAKGHIPYEEVVRNTVSEQEFIRAKKQLVNATDSEIMQYIIAQKQAASANNATAKKNNTRSYRTGVVTGMGNAANKVDNSIKTDTGFDDSAFHEVYEGLRNYKSNGGNISSSGASNSSSYTPSSSSYSGSRGSSSSNYRTSSSNNNYSAVSNANNGIIAGVNLANINSQVTQSVGKSNSADEAKVRPDVNANGEGSLANKYNGERNSNENAQLPTNEVGATNCRSSMGCNNLINDDSADAEKFQETTAQLAGVNGVIIGGGLLGAQVGNLSGLDEMNSSMSNDGQKIKNEEQK